MATVLTQLGEEWIIDKCHDAESPSGNDGEYIGWGTGAGTAAKGDTGLFTEAAEARVAATVSEAAADILRWVATITAASGKTITNAGNFQQSSGANIVVHGDFTGIVLNTGDAIQFTINLEQT